MGILKKILSFMLMLLFIILISGGALLYYQGHGFPQFGHDMAPGDQQDDQGGGQQQQNQQAQTKILTQQDLAQMQITFLNQYVEDINRAVRLINEANGLIISDPFFANPPVISQAPGDTTPFDNQDADRTPSDQRSSSQFPGFMPDYYFYDFKQNRQNVNRGIYKLAQGMTLMNQVTQRMNEDIGRLRTNPSYMPPQAFLQPGYMTPWGMNFTPGMGVTPGMTGDQSSHSMTGTGINMDTITTGLSMFILLLFFLGILAVGGYVLSLFKPRTES